VTGREGAGGKTPLPPEVQVQHFVSFPIIVNGVSDGGFIQCDGDGGTTEIQCLGRFQCHTNCMQPTAENNSSSYTGKKKGNLQIFYIKEECPFRKAKLYIHVSTIAGLILKAVSK
jgi:hypothetical protein